MPTLKVELFNAATGSSIVSDVTPPGESGTWEKSIDGGSSWTGYNTTDKTNEITYIRYTPASTIGGSTIVRALLTQN